MFLWLLATTAVAQNTVPPIGSWREHLPYGSTIDVTASSKKIYCATPYSLFSVDIATTEVERFNKISGLSETGISTIKYDAASDKLFVAYANSNIDVLDKKRVNNIPELKRENIAGDKAVYHIYPAGDLCYLSTGIGVIVLNTTKYEIKDSWIIGTNSTRVKINMVTKDAAFFYAATNEGLKRTAITTSNPADFRAWQNVSGTNGLSAAACKGIVSFDTKIIALQNDTLFVQNGGAWKPFFSNGIPIISINESPDKLLVCQRTLTGTGQVTVINRDGSVSSIMTQPRILSFPQKAAAAGAGYWIADFYEGLSHWTVNEFEQYKVASPGGLAAGEMTVYNNTLYAAAGSVNKLWNNGYNRNGIYRFKEGTWTSYDGSRFSSLDTVPDILTITVDPRNETLWAGSFGGGLIHFNENNSVRIFKQASPISTPVNDPASYRVAGLAFDPDHNLWMANFGSLSVIQVLKKDGTWGSFTPPFFLIQNAAAQIIIDDWNQKWIVSPLGNGLICFNHGVSIDATADDKWKLFKAGLGKGNLPSNDVRCIVKDKNGYIWVGTADGLCIIQCPQDVFTTGCEALLPVAQQGGFANYLFKGEEVHSIAVDGGDRKWIGTGDGAWLLSANGDKVIYHFTEENSFLLSNDVKRIAIDGSTGEVFFATATGICSFRGEATEPAETRKDVLIYPNPVPPGYSGTIAIKGLAQNSFVKITELNGRLVYQTKSVGGQAVWNGQNHKGQPVASGVYLVLIIDEQKREKRVGKIVFISN